MTKQLTGGFYGRKSTEMQRDESIDAQRLVCDRFAAGEGIVIDPAHCYSDLAISGKGSFTDSRPGYQAMLTAWRAGKFDVLLVHTASRLTRDDGESAALRKLISRTGMRVVAVSDGLDTARRGWELMWGLKGVIATQDLKTIATNVSAGMEQSVQAGLSAWDCPYGYTRIPLYDAKGDRNGARWDINPETSAVVLRIFADRLRGLTYMQIARGLIADGVASPGGICESRGWNGLWSVSSVVNILNNSTYVGIINFGGSLGTQYKVRHDLVTRRDLGVVTYLRPDLAFVDTSDFDACSKGSRVVSASGRTHAVSWCSGLVRCTCGRPLTVTPGSVRNADSLHCKHCSSLHARGQGPARGYIGTNQVRALFEFAIPALLTPAVLASFREFVANLQTGGTDAALAAVSARISSFDVQRSRLVKAMLSCSSSSDLIEQELNSITAQRLLALSEQAQLKFASSSASGPDLAAQLAADPAAVVSMLFDHAPPAELRSALSRLFPSVVFLGRPVSRQRLAHFELTISPGVAAALVTSTSILSRDSVTSKFAVLSSGRRSGETTIQLLDAEGSVVSASSAEKMCTKCKTVKPAALFGFADKSRGILACRCKSCASDYYKSYNAAKKSSKNS